MFWSAAMARWRFPCLEPVFAVRNTNPTVLLQQAIPLKFRSNHGHATIDVEGLSGDVGRFLAREINHAGGHVCRRSHSSRGNSVQQGGFLRIAQDTRHGSRDESRS